jgi:hypothetical protein
VVLRIACTEQRGGTGVVSGIIAFSLFLRSVSKVFQSVESCSGVRSLLSIVFKWYAFWTHLLVLQVCGVSKYRLLNTAICR